MSIEQSPVAPRSGDIVSQEVRDLQRALRQQAQRNEELLEINHRLADQCSEAIAREKMYRELWETALED